MNPEEKSKQLKFLVDALIHDTWSYGATNPIRYNLFDNTNRISPSVASCMVTGNYYVNIPKWTYVFIDRDGNKIELKEQEYPQDEHKIPVVEGESKMMHFKLKNTIHTERLAYYMEIFRDE